MLSAGQPTMYPGVGEAREIDFFIIPETLAPYIRSVERVEVPSLSPHRAVCITFVRRQEPYLVQKLVQPRSFGMKKPVGCPRAPVAVEESALALELSGHEDLSSAIQKAFETTLGNMETELCGVTDRMPCGSPDERYCGRARGIKVACRPLLPPRRIAEHGRADCPTNGLIWLRNRVTEFAHLSRKVKDTHFVSVGQRAHWHHAMHRSGRAGTMRRSIVELDPEWALCLADVDGHVLGSDPDLLSAWAARAAEAARIRRAAQVAVQRKQWAQWVRAQLAGGAGALHRLVKRKVETP